MRSVLVGGTARHAERLAEGAHAGQDLVRVHLQGDHVVSRDDRRGAGGAAEAAGPATARVAAAARTVRRTDTVVVRAERRLDPAVRGGAGAASIDRD